MKNSEGKKSKKDGNRKVQFDESMQTQLNSNPSTPNYSLSETCDFGACLRGEILQRILAHDCTHAYTLPCLVVCVRVRVPPCCLPPTPVCEGTKGGVVPEE